MKRVNELSTLFDIAPSLVKEWHPSANGNLTPRNVKINHAKKVWWLCRDSHKWKDTIKGRLKRNDCPICEKEAAKKKADLSLDLPTIGKNKRKSRRFKTKAIAVIEVPDSGHWVYAEMTDFSSHGMCFETEAAVQPGTVVRIKFDKSLVSSRLDKSFKSLIDNGYKSYNSTVKWCRQLDDDQSFSSFGIGVELI
jgi:hypothetical protein